jgi:hypothetical protein
MNHPHELLVDLLDGTLDEADLAGVRAHLDTCGSCRRDLAEARTGARAARSLPVMDPPADLYRRVVSSGGGGGTPTWYRWAGVAAAAAVVVAIAIALPNVGSGPDDDAREAATDAAGSSEVAPLAADVAVSEEDRNYDAGALEDLARSATDARSEATSDGAGGGALDPTAAVRCVSRAFEDQLTGRLTRLIRARFDGEEAYIAVYLEGPGAGEPPDTAAVYAASSENCTVPLSFASARI